MSSLNVGRTGSTFMGGWLYDQLGLTLLIVASAGFTGLCWLIVPFLQAREHQRERG
jgi:predicted MFS family arabinose efflux permease